MTCQSCPFTCSEEAEQVINYGCVPSSFEIMTIKRDHNQNWGCHSEDKLCAGFVQECKELGIDYKDGNLLLYRDWYHHGPGLQEMLNRPK